MQGALSRQTERFRVTLSSAFPVSHCTCGCESWTSNSLCSSFSSPSFGFFMSPMKATALSAAHYDFPKGNDKSQYKHQQSTKYAITAWWLAHGCLQLQFQGIWYPILSPPPPSLSLSHSHRKTCNEVIKIFKLTPYVFGIPYPGVGYISQAKENIKNIFETDLALLSVTWNHKLKRRIYINGSHQSVDLSCQPRT